MPRFISTMLQWAIYFLPTIIAIVRRRSGKQVPLHMGLFIFMNVLMAWTVVVWILLMLNAFGLNPVPQVAMWLVKVLPKSGGAPMNAAPAWEGGPSPVPACSQCGGSGSVTCPHCQGRGQWYTQPTTANGIPQLERCSYCVASGRIRCPNTVGHHA